MIGLSRTSFDRCVRASQSRFERHRGRLWFVDVPLPLSMTGVQLHGQWLAVGSGVHAPGGVSDALLWRR